MRLILVSLCLLLLGGCNYTTRSGLPAHIKTVEIPTARNPKTFYKGIEGKLTRKLIEHFNRDPQVRVVNTGGDAILTSVIIDVSKTPYRETKQDRPATIRLSVTARYDFFDQVEQRFIVEKARISSTQFSSDSGIYEVERGELPSRAEDAAVDELAREIVRATMNTW
jgi:hypothetical protein